MKKTRPTSRTSLRVSGRGSASAAGADAPESSLSAQLRAAMADMGDVMAGRVRAEERLTLRTVQLPDEPADYGARDVRALRERLNVSQRVFARMLGASPALVRTWEQGGRVPSPIARRLLDTIRRDPRP